MARNRSAVRRAGIAACSAGLMLAAGALQPAGADTAPVAADYNVYAGGLHVLTSVLEIRLDDERYNARLDAELVGAPGWFVDWWAVVESGGQIDGDDLDPMQYSAERTRRGETQKTLLDFARDGEVDVTFDPERSDSVGLVSPELMAESLDPLSGLISIINNVTDGGTCEAIVPVFDGRRRYDLVFSDLGLDDLQPSRRSGFAGEARRCRMKLEPVAGAFKDDDDDDDDFWSRKPENERRRQLDIWLAQPIADGPILPVKMVGRSSIGAVVIHLRSAQVTVETLDAELPGACAIGENC